MSLMRLLAATRSIVNIRDRRSPYEMRRQNLLPKFGPVARADGNDGLPSAVSAPEDGDGEAGAGPGGSGALPRTEPQDSKGQSQMNSIANQKQEESPGTLTAEPPVRAAYPHGRWTLFRPGAARPVPTEPRIVQGELALDTVKVVRNDLNEADLEVVLARKAPAAPAPVVSAPPEKSKASPRNLRALHISTSIV